MVEKKIKRNRLIMCTEKKCAEDEKKMVKASVTLYQLAYNYRREKIFHK